MSSLLKRLENLSPQKRELVLKKLREQKSISTTHNQHQAPPIIPVPRNQNIPLSFAQQRLWFLEQLVDSSSTYNMSAAVQITGSLGIDALKQTLQAILLRHEVLRTRFHQVNGIPVQVIEPNPILTVSLVDLQELPEVEQLAEVKKFAALKSEEFFDLSTDLLLRATLLRLGQESHVLVLVMHHIVSDGWSMGIFMQEFSSLYPAFLTKQPSPLPELPIQYADFTIWQRQWLTGEVLANKLNYWKQKLADAPSLLELPTDRPRPPVERFKGGTWVFQFDTELTQKIKTLSQKSGATLFMTLETAFVTLLHRLSGQDDILVGTPIANRNRRETEPLIGFFVNTLVLRTQIQGNPSFEELLAQVRQVALEAYEHQDLPFEQVVEALQPERSLSHSPLFQVMFVLQNTPMGELELPGLTLTPVEIKNVTAKRDLTLSMEDSSQGLEGVWEYNTDLFDCDTIVRIAGHFKTLLEAIVAYPEQAINELPLLSQKELQQLLVTWNDNQTDYPADKCLHQLFEEQVQKTPDAVAVVYKNKQLTYNQLNRHANKLAHRLQELGVKPEMLVGICVERSLEIVVGLLGILKAGGAYVPLDPNYPQERLDCMLSDSQLSVLLTQSKLVDRFCQHQAHIICLDQDWGDFSQMSEENPISAVTSKNLAYIIYTSGSTGKPKGTMIPHQGLVNYLIWCSKEYAVASGSGVPVQSSIAFDATITSLFSPLLVGERVILLPEKQEIEALGVILREQRNLSLVKITPAHLDLLNQMLPSKEIQQSTKALVIGGETLQGNSLSLWQTYAPSTRLINEYGPTETVVGCCIYEVTQNTPLSKIIPIGRPIANTQLYILDRFLQPVPVGVRGELYIGGAGVARGYLNRPDLTEEKFIPNPFGVGRLYKTGDLARYLPDGNIEFLGRTDDLVKIRGFRIELGEIEAVLVQHPQVQETTVTVQEDQLGNKRLVAYVVPNSKDLDVGTQIPDDDFYTEQLSQWQQVFNDSYSQSTVDTDPTFNIIGWNDSCTGKLIPKEEMHEWVERTVARILSRSPNRVLEIGCGTGLLLFRIAKHCSSYVGTDISHKALDYIEQQMRNFGEAWSQVTLEHKPANDFDSFKLERFDAVILNSVVQYFPNINYLVNVLENAVKTLAPGGFIFVGDVRSLPLLEAFHTYVQLHQAPHSLSKAELRQRVQRSINQDPELVIDPAFFIALRQHIPQITHVEIQLKGGHYFNELTRFRYDVILHVGAEVPTTIKPQWLDWQKDKLTLPDVRQLLVEKKPEILGIKNVPNARVATPVKLVELLVSEDESATVGELWEALEEMTKGNEVDPEDLWNLSYELPYKINIYWGQTDALDCYEVMFQYSPSQLEVNGIAPVWGETCELRPWNTYANNPLQGKVAHKLIPQLRGFLKEKLPDFMIPNAFMLLDALPLTPNGKVDRRTLPIPDLELSRSVDFVAPSNPSQEAIANIFAEVLGIQQVGIHDNFFELGGHSLLATQAVSRLQETFKIELPLRFIFEFPTVAELDQLVSTQNQKISPLRTPPIQPVPRDTLELPLSWAQQRLWFLSQLEGASASYNMPAAIEITGILNVNALERTLQEILQRHELLRTGFDQVNGIPMQIINPNAVVNLQVVDLQGLAVDEQSIKVKKLAALEANEPFDLKNAPLVRATLLRLSVNSQVLLLTMHHIISDGWSMGIFIQELSILYQAFSSGLPSPLPKLSIQYIDFAIWQQQWLSPQVLETQLNYWKQQLAGIPPLLELPTDRSRPPVQTFKGSNWQFQINPDLTQKLNTLSQKLGVTLFMTLTAVFATLLSRYSGQDDIVIGTPVANRNRREIEPLIGFFVNTLVLRIQLQENLSFCEFLKKVQQVALDAYAHQDVPFEQVVEVLQPERNLSHSPLFQVMFVLQNTPTTGKLEFPGLTLTPLQIENVTAKFDLLLSIEETPQGLTCLWEYNTDLFEADTIARIAEHFQTMLAAVVTHPDQPIKLLPLLSEQEQHQLLVTWNNNQTEPSDKSIHQLFEEQVQKTPGAIAVTYDSQQLTYHELNTRANQLAHYLQTLGVKTDVLVGLCVERSLEMVLGLLAILKAGGAYVPLDPAYPKERLSYMLNDSRASVLLTQSQLLDRLPPHKHIVCLDTDFQKVCDKSQSNPVSTVNLENLVYVIYTSGSTGKPKGVAMKHRSLSNLILWQIKNTHANNDAKTLQFAPISFDVSCQEIFSTWCSGGTLVLVSEEMRRDGLSVLHLLEAESIERVFLPFVALQQLAEVASNWEVLPSNLREVIVAGEQLQITPAIASFFDKLPNCVLQNQYGPSESHVVTAFSCTGTVSNWSKLPPIGRPITNTQIYILDSYLQPVPIGVKGELHIGGASIARGYLNRPDLSSQKFIPNPFGVGFLYKTGDLARYRKDSNIEFLGRIDDQVKVRGFRIELAEIEAVLTENPQIEESVVIAQKDQLGNQHLVAYIVPYQDSSPTTRELVSFLKQKVPDYMVPSSFVMLDTLPLTPSGKIDRRALRKEERSIDLSCFVAPRDTIELQLAQIWSEVLELEWVGVRDNFFELGGHSLRAVRLMAQIHQQFGKNLPLATLFQKPTIEELGSVLRESTDSLPWSCLVPIQPEGSKPPLFCIPGAGGNVIYFYDLARYLGTDQPFYGLQAYGLDGELEPIAQVKDIAAKYIEAIQTIRPQGPYMLGGHSFGGLVAFEMATQLQQQGHEVALLAIFDTIAPILRQETANSSINNATEDVNKDDAMWLMRLANIIERFAGNNLEISNEDLQLLNPPEQLKFLLERLKIANILPPAMELEQFKNFVQVFKVQSQSFGDYLPQNIYKAQINLFRAREVSAVELADELYCAILKDPTLGWNKLCINPINIYSVPGDHMTMMSKPNVQVLAEQLNMCIESL